MQSTTAIFDAYESRSWRSVARRQRAQGMEFVVGRRDGAYVWDVEGRRRLLDCSTSGGVHALGHRNPEVLAALREALDDGLDGGLWMFPNAPYLALQDSLAATAPDPALNRSVITLAASASNDLALLFAFRMTGRNRVVAYRHGYHGHGGFAALVTGSRDEGIAAHYGLNQDCGRFFATYGDLAAIDALLDDRVAAVIIEPFDYETFAPPPAEFLPALAALCRARGAFLIVDETRTGLARSGRLWMCEHSGVVPDMLVSGKGLSGGLYPASALITTEAIYERCINQHDYAYASSLGGNEISAWVACKVIEIASRPSVLAHVGALEAAFRARFAELCRRHQGVFRPGTTLGGIATIGLCDPAHRTRLPRALFASGILCHSVSAIEPSVVKFFPVLTAELGIVDEIADALDRFAREAGS
jgi:acetylornithine/succinyldiaminopimelate/putrescine aminotransferase